MNSSIYRKAVSLLTHPLSIFALLVLFINDHFLRVYYPSWITGKLGDFAWLYISPLALAAILAVLFPRHLDEHSRTTILLSIGLISGIFLLGKTSVLVNAWMNEGIGFILGRPISLHRDPTDLIALLAPYGAYLAWIKSPTPEKANARMGFALLVISAALTIANAAEPDYGITCLAVEESRLVAGNNWYQYYESRNGGISWEEISGGEEYRCDPYSQEEIELSVMDNQEFIYRAGKETVLEESQDGGTSWAPVSGIQHLSQAEIAWLEGTRSVFYQPGPLAAVSEPGSGNLVFAMGLEGALVRTIEGEWIPVAVGDYQLVSLTPARIPGLLKYEIVLAAAYALLLPMTRAIFSGKSLFQKIWLGLVWGAWFFTLAFFKPALQTGYSLIIINAVVIFLAISTIILVGLYFAQSWEILKGRMAKTVGTILVGLIAILSPYGLWALNIIPDYDSSLVLALCLGSALMAVRVIWLGERDS